MPATWMTPTSWWHAHTPVRRAAIVLAATAALLAGCSSSGGEAASPSPSPARPGGGSRTAAGTPAPTDPPADSLSGSATPLRPARVYVAVGASDTVGVGSRHPRRQAWPRLLHDRSLRGSRYVNVGVSGSTAAQALRQQVPAAVRAKPDVVTVWLSVNDLIGLVPVSTYEDELGRLVHRLRRGGRTEVLVGNVPPLERLPAYRACLPGAEQSEASGGLPCRLPFVPPQGEVRRQEAAYNAAVARVVSAEGAVLVDLSGARRIARLTAADGFHPNTRGHRLLARLFGEELTKPAS